MWDELWDEFGLIQLKPTGKHHEKRLTDVAVRKLSRPGRHADGGGLYLIVDPSGARRWVLRIVVTGKRRDLGLGGYPLVPLAEAREVAREMRKLARAGGDPISERRARRAVPTFEEAARIVFNLNTSRWKNPKHSHQWIRTLEVYAFPTIGNQSVSDIKTPALLSLLQPFWLAKPETARRVRQRIATVFDWAKAAGHLSGENPVHGVSKGLPKHNRVPQHMSAMPYTELPAFIKLLRERTPHSSAKLALEFLILTASRTGEIINATWDEFCLDTRTWTIPASRMKAGREHRVPLSDRCLDIMVVAEELWGPNGFLFPGSNHGKPLSNMAMLTLLRRMAVSVTVHGFRSSFRDWCAEATGFPHAAAEKALAHEVGTKVEAAYLRSDMLEKRREIMNAWSYYLFHPNNELRLVRTVE